MFRHSLPNNLLVVKIELLQEAMDMRLYQVGGCVRDRLMGQEPRDVDWLVVGSCPSEMIALGYSQVGADFPVFLHPDTKEEYALARTERKTSAGHKGFETLFDKTVTVEEDLMRRDLTVNAMAYDPKDGSIVDPFGGRSDIEKKILRHVSEAFSEDPLRVLRIARFQARTGFSIANETFDLCSSICESGALRELSPERICSELRKTFSGPMAANAMRSMREMGALDSISAGWGARLDESTLDALDQACLAQAPEWERVAIALCSKLGAEEAQRLLADLRFPAELSKKCARLAAFNVWGLLDRESPSEDETFWLDAAEACERSFLPKMTPAQLDEFTAALGRMAERQAPEELHRLEKALEIAKSSSSMAKADLTAALAAPRDKLAFEVKKAKANALKREHSRLFGNQNTGKPIASKISMR